MSTPTTEAYIDRLREDINNRLLAMCGGDLVAVGDFINAQTTLMRDDVIIRPGVRELYLLTNCQVRTLHRTVCRMHEAWVRSARQ